MKSILFAQYGDFAEAFHRLREGGAENYRDQKASVDFVTGLAPEARVTTFAFGAGEARIELAPELWATGGTRETFGAQQISKLFDETEVTHLILRTPHVRFLREAGRRGIAVLPCFADIFGGKGLRGRYRHWQLRRALQKCQAPCVSNHSLNASRSLVEALGWSAKRVVPWDWTKVPLVPKGKDGPADPNNPTAFFAGAISENKGVGDCLDAIASLRDDGVTLTMSFAGPGDIPAWQARAAKLGISEQTNFLGMISNADVRAKMHDHDFVIVPSRHSYAEGLPNTIYEGLASRSALVISDHPAFAERLVADKECLVFPAANPQELAACLKRAVGDPDLYRRLSQNAPAAHDQLYIGMEWTTLVTRFLDDPDDHTGWVEENSLETLAPL